MKRIALALFVSCTLGGAALAQTQAEPQRQAPAQYQKTTHLTFDEGEQVRGEMQRPEGIDVNARKRANQRSLIRVRTQFHYEMLKSAEQL